jgi:1-deoxy-D-xylulose-5-phosphate synthase
VVATPSDENETRLLLTTCYQHPGPASVRYPRGSGAGAVISAGLETVPIGRGIVRRQGKDLALLVFGTLLPAALKVAESLDLTVVDMRFVKPLDAELVRQMAAEHRGLITLEEGAIMGGAGSAVTEFLNSAGLTCSVLQLGLPDRFIDHGEQGALLAGVGLDAAGIERSIRARFIP